ncbi:neuronal acetylcholine receptor subunit alpha-10-like [Ornithodoros turicata]|uniref:neuronal acetylcholine receptor subunit alpha-10-like n=1 Tax=Ornithodoros turicata TaxID=34597 RepID=UPI003138E9DD
MVDMTAASANDMLRRSTTFGNFLPRCIVLNVLVLYVCRKYAAADEQEYRLTRYLMSNYDPAVRPSFNSTLPLRVEIDLALLQVLQVDAKAQVLSTNCRLIQRWIDAHLKWNSSDFGGIGVLRIPAPQVWKPDVVLYNNAQGGDHRTSLLSSNVVVRSSGEVSFLSQASFASTCHFDLRYFPFDVHDCHLHFVSWTYDTLQVELEPVQGSEADQDSRQGHGEFDVDSVTVTQHVRRHGMGEGAPSFRDVTFSVRLRRRPAYHLVSLVLPCVLLNALALLSFLVPCESGEKLTLGVNTLLCSALFLVLVRDSLPPTHSMPIICLYYGVTVLLVTCAAGFSVLTLSLHQRGARGLELPRSLRSFVLGYLARLFFLGCCSGSPAKTKSCDLTKDPKSSHPLQQHSPIQHFDSDKLELDHIERYNFSPRLRHRKEFCAGLGGVGGSIIGGVGPPSQPGATPEVTCASSSDEFEKQFLRVLAKVYDTIEKNEHRTAERDRRDTIRSDWHQVAVVCDRVLLAVFLLAMAIATFLVLFSSRE